MTRRTRLSALLTLIVLAAPVAAQLPPLVGGHPAPLHLPPPLPGRAPAPLLYTRLAGPPGTHVTFYRGTQPHSFAAPLTVGLRPGYVYRLLLTDLPGRPEASLAPTLEVRGTLALPPKLSAADYPAPVVFSEADVERALAGTLVTKVVYLEHPDRAVPVATSKEQPIETTLGPGEDLLAAARERGRPVLIMRMGGRVLSAEEVAAESVPGTVLLPGEKAIGLPPVPPPLLWSACRFYDPRLGPKPPEEECLHDGGDRGPPAGLRPDGRLGGLDPEDTVAEYTDAAGRRHLTHSNRVCLCVPRFAVLRAELPLGGYDTLVRVDDTTGTQVGDLLRTRLPPAEAEQTDRLRAFRGRMRPGGTVNVKGPGTLLQFEVLNARGLELGPEAAIGTSKVLELTERERLQLRKQIALVRELDRREGVRENDQTTGTGVVGRVEGGPQVIRATVEVRDLTVCCNEAPCPPDKPLRLFKWADRQAAQVGDEVTFTLKYTNLGGRPMTDVAVSDSLSPRLEYVPGSARSDRDAVFTVQPNEAGSVVLRWELGGRLLPGQSGLVRFRARVR